MNLIKKLSWSNNSDKPWTFLWGKRTDLFLFLIKPLWIWVWLLCSPVQVSFYSRVKGGMSPFISSELGAWMQSWALVKFVTYMAYYIWLLYTFSYFELYYLLFWLLLDFVCVCDSVPHLFLKELGRSHFVIRDWILLWWLAGHFILTVTLAILKASFLSLSWARSIFHLINSWKSHWMNNLEWKNLRPFRVKEKNKSTKFLMIFFMVTKNIWHAK